MGNVTVSRLVYGTFVAFALTLLTLLAVGSCASRGGAVRTESMEMQEPAPGAETPHPEEPPSEEPHPEEPKPEPPLQPDPPSQPDPPQPATCIPTHAGDCVAAADFEAAAEALAEQYRAHQNFQSQWGLSHVGADYAYAHVNQLKGAAVAPGAGVTIGFIDSGIDQGHPDFAGKTITEVLIGSATDETGDRFSHGTAVASVAAAIRTLNDKSAHGVAWGADIAMFAIPVGSGGGTYHPITLSSLDGADAGWGNLFDYVFAWRRGGRGADVLNLSIGFSGIIDSYSEQELRDNFGMAIAAMAQAGAGDKTILVWAAGNAHGDPCDPAETEQCVGNKVDAVSVEVLPGLVARIAELQGHTIAVVALREDGAIADFSNRCGIAADNCIAAPGEQVRVAYFGPKDGSPVRGYTDVRGTSVAAPFVAGGLAVMKQLFRDQLSNPDLVARLFATADDQGIYADRAVYGQGAMDLRAASWPVGVLDVPVGSNRVDGRGAALAATGLHAGTAFGDAIERSLSGREIAAFDTLGAPFWFDLGDFTAPAAARGMMAEDRALMAPPSTAPAPDSAAGDAPWLSGWLRTLATDSSYWRAVVLERPPFAAGGHLALAERALGLTLTDRRALTGTAFTTEGGLGQIAVSGAALSWQPSDVPFGLHAGWLSERESVLGSTGAGAFGTLAGETAFAGAAAGAALGEWRLRAGAELGTVRAVSHGGVVSEISPLTTSALSVAVRRPFATGETLRFSVSQPLRVEAGRAALAVPSGRTKAGDVVYSAVTADLTPSGRQIDVTAEWHQPLAIGELRVGAAVTLQPGHRAAAAPEFLVLGGWRWRR